VKKIQADIDAKDISSFINDGIQLITQVKQAVADCKI